MYACLKPSDESLTEQIVKNVNKTIQIEFCHLSTVVSNIEHMPRSIAIKAKKQAIAEYRNQLLTQYLDQEITDADVLRTSYGKPYLKDHAQFYFNHSHSQHYYALATSQRYADLGIDIEELSRNVRFDALAQHAFHPNELQKWQDSDFDKSYWFKVWTTKEAVLKASGLGIRINLNEFDTQAHPIHDGGMCQYPSIGHFAYQNIQVGDVMLTVAWAAEASCKGFNFPKIELHSTFAK